ncbi:PIN/TRAM domain-containing protein [Alkalithermobacter paradoxus]|uniref:Putative PIN and TRAM-domain containing protein n=1 Tax=Alkalithermobacter paradoxus TaxID=29349 RepID=A0A1V4I4Y8_9FIRM|nr:putative PIN and TRAM-domain containing protein precursor [[Clostridium] thermoalcaliphilum]
MINKMIKALMSLVGITIGVAIYFYSLNIFPQLLLWPGIYKVLAAALSGIITGLIFYLISPWILQEGRNLANWVDGELSKIPPIEILIGSIGLTIGLIIAYLISQLLIQIPVPIVGSIISIIVYIFMGYIGVHVALKNREELFNIGSLLKISNPKDKSSKKVTKPSPKVLDTSVIIDGRIADICKTGFVEGKLVIPNFVLEELRHIADSADDLKRVRGRRGLDILNKIQKEIDIEVEIYEKDFEDIAEVDSKLLKLAQLIEGKVVTNDYNLNKVAQFHGVEVLNINELANAIKPVVIPGEEMIVQIIKDGKELGQGVAYLDDGTMIVVDGGRKYIGDTIDVLVTSVLQTAAGRMIFARPKMATEKSI